MDSINLQDRIQIGWKSREFSICNQEATVKINAFRYNHAKKGSILSCCFYQSSLYNSLSNKLFFLQWVDLVI